MNAIAVSRLGAIGALEELDRLILNMEAELLRARKIRADMFAAAGLSLIGRATEPRRPGAAPRNDVGH